MSKIIVQQYDGIDVPFTGDGWFNATAVAAKRGKRIDHWLENKETGEYMQALARALNTRNPGDLIRTRRGRGGGTWMHPKLGVPFARWVDVDFAIWCDLQIDTLLRGGALDWGRARHEAASSFKVMTDAVLVTRQDAGKRCAPHHFSNEARLVNWAMSGAFKGLDREAMSKEQLDLLAKLEIRNTVLIAQGVEYEERRTKMFAFATAWKAAHPDLQLEVA